MKKRTKSANSRPTIGFLNASGLEFFHLAWCGFADVAREHDMNAVNFVGQYVRDPKGFNAQANILYDLIDAEHLDGLVIQDLMCNLLDPDEAEQFYERYRSLSIVSIGRRLIEGIPCIQSSGYAGMRQAIEHLIEVHGLRRIAFIKGLPNYRPHDERYEAYVDVLDEYGLPFDPARVAVPHDATEEEQPDWGQVALHRLLDEQKADFDALVTNDDRFAHALLPELQNRGIRVPDDIALVSFDDEEGSDCLTPPLTTVPIPINEMGRKAAETLVAILEGQKEIDQIIDVPSDRLIVRQSCGCLDPKVMQIITGPVKRTEAAEPLEVSLAGQRESILTEMIQTVENSAVRLIPNWAEQLLNDFVAALTTTSGEEASARFLATLDEILRQVLAVDGDIEVWQQVLSALRRQILPYLNIDEARDRANDLCLQAQLMMAEVRLRVHALEKLQATQQAEALRELGQVLITTFDIDRLADMLAERLPEIGITSCYLAIYEKPSLEYSNLILAYTEQGRIDLGDDEHRFPSHELVPPGLLPQHRQYNYVVEALYFQHEQIGFAVFEAGPNDRAIYEFLRVQISSALKGALLLQEAQQARQAAERADRIKTRLLANVSHELRTPLNVILGYSHDALGASHPYGITPPQALLDDLKHIHDAAEHQLRVVNDLLDLSRAEIDELDLYLELLAPRPLLQDVFNSIGRSANEPTVTWQLQLPDRLPSIQADPVRLRQVFLNLLSNAGKFTEQGKVILGAQVEPPHLHLWVQDTGKGISPVMQERIFEPFVTVEHTTRRREGVGLGLSITRRLVALHGGSMKLESQPGSGSTFHVYLPLPNLADRTARAAESTQPVLLLITATDQPLAEIIELGQRQGLVIQRLQAGDDLDALLNNVQPAALAWDIAGAGPNDWGVFRQIRNHPRLSHLPFILYGHDESTERSFGLTSVITKPASAPTLLDAINALSPQEIAGPILIVEDDPVARQEHLDMIEQGLPGYPVYAVNDGAAALEAMDRQTPSLVLLDLMMPELDGFNVLDWMREDPRTFGVPVVILTSKVLSTDDIERIEQHTQVVVQSKGVLTDDEIVAALNRSLFGDESLPLQTSALVKRAIAYLHQNYTRPLTRWEIAEAIGVSENYFSRLFKQELGLSPWDYLNRFRIYQAKELFLRTQDSVKNVASQVGFKDEKYFSRVFQKVTGLSPTEFIEQPNP